MSVSISTKIPQAALRTYAIKMDANGGNFGNDSSGNAITENTMTFNAKDSLIAGTYAQPQRNGYVLYGWSTKKDANAVADETNANVICLDSWIITIEQQGIQMPPIEAVLADGVPRFVFITGHDDTHKGHDAFGDQIADPVFNYNWMSERPDKSVTTVYAVWKRDPIYRYAVMAYYIYDLNPSEEYDRYCTIFGPALGYSEFSALKDGVIERSVTPTMSHHHDVSGSSTQLSESAATCKDDSHSIITGTDAGTDAKGNKYRCLHYDNWATISYWNYKDPHVYDKCIKKGCSKTVVLKPNDMLTALGFFSDDSFTGDGNSYVARDIDFGNATSSHKDGNDTIGDGTPWYACSAVRAMLNGGDAYTDPTLTIQKGSTSINAASISEDESLLSCFPTYMKLTGVYKNRYDVPVALSTGDTQQESLYDVLKLPSLDNVSSGGAEKVSEYSCGSIKQDDLNKNNSARASNLPLGSNWYLGDTADRYPYRYVVGRGGNVYLSTGNAAVAPMFALGPNIK